MSIRSIKTDEPVKKVDIRMSRVLDRAVTMCLFLCLASSLGKGQGQAETFIQLTDIMTYLVPGLDRSRRS